MIVLKHLAQQFNADPAELRRIVRNKLGKIPGRRWKWLNEKDPHYQKVLSTLSQHYGTPTSSSPSLSTTAAASSTTLTPSRRASSSATISGVSPKKKTR